MANVTAGWLPRRQQRRLAQAAAVSTVTAVTAAVSTAFFFARAAAATDGLDHPEFELVRALDRPVIGASDGKKHGNNGGFEGGLYTRTPDGVYHLFPTECMSDMPGVPWDIHTESHHWTSPDGRTNWTQRELVYNSSAVRDGTDRRGAIFAPMNIFDPDTDRWNMFYIGYTCDPGQKDGAIYRIVSQTPGMAGVAGPYPPHNGTIVLDEEMGAKEPWEGYQGTDSFHAWQLDNGTWMAFYGSHGSTKTWQVGLATASRLGGPWRRCPWLNPCDYIESPEGVENPIVTRTTDHTVAYPFVAVYDALMPDQIHGSGDVVGITQSADGVHWSPAQYVALNASASGCGAPVRTPQGLVPEPGLCQGCYSMLYTGMGDGYRNECWVLLRNRAEL